MSDVQRIIKYMQEHKSITVKECNREIGTGDLRRRIRDIKDRGYEIGDVWEEGENRVGRPTRYKRYFILKEPTNLPPEPKPKKKHNSLLKFVKDLFSY